MRVTVLPAAAAMASVVSAVAVSPRDSCSTSCSTASSATSTTATTASSATASASAVASLLATVDNITAGAALDFVDMNPFDITPVKVSKERHSHDLTWTKLNGDYVDWNTYDANGVNLGCWLELEYSCYEDWWASFGTGATDEWHFCEALGEERCAEVLENHYATFMNESTIDALGSVGVNTLRIPTTYAAWIKVPGSELYHGHQRKHLKKIMNYAIEKYQMHIAIDLHSLPGGVNDLDIGEAYGHDAWFLSTKNLKYSLKAVEKMLDFIVKNDFQKWVTIEPLNEAANDFDNFGTCDGLTVEGKEWIAVYINLVLDKVAKVDSSIPVMLQDCFCGESTWSPYFNASDNLVIDTHVYYFADAGVYSEYVAPAVCGQAATLAGDGIFPVFVGEWSLQTTYNNTFDNRATIFDTQRYAWSEYVHGGAFWSAVHYGNATVSGQGDQEDYWSYLLLIEEGVITSATNSSYC